MNKFKQFRFIIIAIIFLSIFGYFSYNFFVGDNLGADRATKSTSKIFDSDEHLMAEFNKDGTFFYNTSGIEVAKFAIDEARVGNIVITPTTIQSGNFVSNVSGFRISDSGYAEFEDCRVRGVLAVTVFEYNTVSAVGGQIVVGNSSQLVEDMTALDTSTLEVEEALFSDSGLVHVLLYTYLSPHSSCNHHGPI